MANINKLFSKILIFGIRCYRFFLSPLLGERCRFFPSCSCYAQEAITELGTIKGGWLALKRLVKCHPFHPGGYDPLQLAQGKKHEL